MGEGWESHPWINYGYSLAPTPQIFWLLGNQPVVQTKRIYNHYLYWFKPEFKTDTSFFCCLPIKNRTSPAWLLSHFLQTWNRFFIFSSYWGLLPFHKLSSWWLSWCSWLISSICCRVSSYSTRNHSLFQLPLHHTSRGFNHPLRRTLHRLNKAQSW